jgi:DeoR family fructose operon transcriptional repressor
MGDWYMFTIERQQAIMDILKAKKSVTVTELSKKFYISEATIRRDLEKLKKKPFHTGMAFPW